MAAALRLRCPVCFAALPERRRRKFSKRYKGTRGLTAHIEGQHQGHRDSRGAALVSIVAGEVARVEGLMASGQQDVGVQHHSKPTTSASRPWEAAVKANDVFSERGLGRLVVTRSHDPVADTDKHGYTSLCWAAGANHMDATLFLSMVAAPSSAGKCSAAYGAGDGADAGGGGGAGAGAGAGASSGAGTGGGAHGSVVDAGARPSSEVGAGRGAGAGAGSAAHAGGTVAPGATALCCGDCLAPHFCKRMRSHIGVTCVPCVESLKRLTRTMGVDGRSALHWAARNGALDVAHWILCSLRSQAGRFGDPSRLWQVVHGTPLVEEVCGCPQSAPTLESGAWEGLSDAVCLPLGASRLPRCLVDVRTSADGTTPLQLACYGGHLDLAKLLVAWGANPWHRNDYMCSCAHWACMGTAAGCASVVEWLIATEIAVLTPRNTMPRQTRGSRSGSTAGNGSGTTSKTAAARAGAHSLCGTSVRFDQKQKSGVTPVHKAAVKGAAVTVELLVARLPAEVLAIKDESGYTAAELARYVAWRVVCV